MSEQSLSAHGILKCQFAHIPAPAKHYYIWNLYGFFIVKMFMYGVRVQTETWQKKANIGLSLDI